jgi:uncharacterized protein YjbI with pentapeptide repeats
VINLKAVNLEAVNLEAVYLKAVNLQGIDREACVMEVETLFIGELVIVGMQRIEYNKVC